MLNFIYADLRRIFFRVPRLIGTVLMYAALVLTLNISTLSGVTPVGFVSAVSMFVGISAIVWGLFILIAVFADDFKAKTMQVAIGLGIPRSKIVIGKLLETVILTTFELSVLFLSILIASVFLKAGLNVSQVQELFICCCMAGINVISYISLTMILMFFTQSTGGGRVLYLALTSTMVFLAVDLLTSVEALERLHIAKLTLHNILEVGRVRWIVGTFDLRLFAGIILYVVLATILTIVLFRKRELEF